MPQSILVTGRRRAGRSPPGALNGGAMRLDLNLRLMLEFNRFMITCHGRVPVYRKFDDLLVLTATGEAL
jgi:hypothetical protein